MVARAAAAAEVNHRARARGVGGTADIEAAHAQADAVAAAVAVTRELAVLPLRIGCLDTELRVRGIFVRVLVSALNRGGGGAALQGATELLDAMLEVRDATAAFSANEAN